MLRNSKEAHQPVDLEARPSDELNHVREHAIRTAASDAISRHGLFVQILSRAPRCFWRFLSSKDHAPGSLLHLLTHLLLVIPDIGVNELAVVSIHRIQVAAV